MPKTWKPVSDLAKIVYDAGFNYDPDQDIIYSRMYPWQRNFGYAYSYDLAAPVTISAVIDCEPFFFNYKGKDWMIELWKGQYGLETGGEIGIYVCNQPLLNPILGNRPHDPDHGKFYDCIKDSERMRMSFTLYRDGKPLFTRGPEKHWWLTGFKWGVLSKPEELSMDLQIIFPNTKMQSAFLQSLSETGYTDVTVEGLAVRFVFDKPKTFQSRADPKNAQLINSVRKNELNLVRTYNAFGLENNDPNQPAAEAAEEIPEYFTHCNPAAFVHSLAEHRDTTNGTATQFIEAIQNVEKRNRTRVKRIGIALHRFFDRLFG